MNIFSLRGYNLEVKCRESGLRGGGVGAYIRSSLKYNVLNYTTVEPRLIPHVKTCHTLPIRMKKKNPLFRRKRGSVDDLHNTYSSVVLLIHNV